MAPKTPVPENEQPPKPVPTLANKLESAPSIEEAVEHVTQGRDIPQEAPMEKAVREAPSMEEMAEAIDAVAKEPSLAETAQMAAKAAVKAPLPTPRVWTYHCSFLVHITGPALQRDMILTLSENITEQNYQVLKG